MTAITRATARKIESCERRDEASAPAAREVHEWGGRRRTWKRFAPTESVASVTNTPMLRKSWRKMPAEEEERWNAARERAEVGEGGRGTRRGQRGLSRAHGESTERARTHRTTARQLQNRHRACCLRACTSSRGQLRPAPCRARARRQLLRRTLGLEHDLCGSRSMGQRRALQHYPRLQARASSSATRRGGSGSRPTKAAKKPAVATRRVMRKPGCENLHDNRGRARVSKSPRGRRRGGDEEGTGDAHRADAEAAVRHRRWTCAGWRRRADRRCSARGRARGWLADLRAARASAGVRLNE